jgi:hypothetical protein
MSSTAHAVAKTVTTSTIGSQPNTSCADRNLKPRGMETVHVKAQRLEMGMASQAEERQWTTRRTGGGTATGSQLRRV